MGKESWEIRQDRINKNIDNGYSVEEIKPSESEQNE